MAPAITPSVMAEMMFDRGLTPSDVRADRDMQNHILASLIAWGHRLAQAPADLDAVRSDLARLCNGERPVSTSLARPSTSHAALDAGFVSPAA